MRSAPSVLIPVGRSRLGAAVFIAAWLAGFALLVAWRLQAPAPSAWAGLSGVQVVMGALLLVCGALAWRSHRRASRGLLDADGDSWCWTTAQGACAAQVTVVCDGQWFLLVRLQPDDGSGVQWLWLLARSGPQHWRAVRRALYFRASREAPPDGTAAMP
jgi:hypothetical protein